MAHQRRWHLWSGILGGLVAALVVSALPAVADTVGDLVGTQAVLSPGDPLQAGRVNQIDKTTWLRGSWPNSMLRVVNDGSGPALELNTAPGVAPLAVDSRKLVRGLNVDRVDNRHANQMVRAAGARSNTVDEGTFVDGAADVLTTTIIAPASGMLVMGGSIDATGAAQDYYTCRLNIDGVLIEGTNRISQVQILAGHTANGSENCSTDGVHVVGRGTYTVALRVEGRESVFFGPASLWVLWVGFDRQGLKPTESSISGPPESTPPVVTNSAGPLAYTEGDGPVAIDPAVTVTDVDSANLQGASVVITANLAETEDVLGCPACSGAGISATFTPSTGTLDLSGEAAVGTYKTVLASVSYENTSSNPSTATRTVTFAAHDGVATGSDTIDITVTDANTPPSITTNAGLTVPDASTGSIIGPSALETTDSDTVPGSLVYTLLSTPSDGTLKLSHSPLGVSGTFTQADINSFDLSFDHHGVGPGADSFDFTVTDGTTTLTDTFLLTVT